MTLDLYEKYKYKIKALDELKKIIGAFPRDKKVVMCHGNFDVVRGVARAVIVSGWSVVWCCRGRGFRRRLLL